jgi:hypothetical protein
MKKPKRSAQVNEDKAMSRFNAELRWEAEDEVQTLLELNAEEARIMREKKTLGLAQSEEQKWQRNNVFKIKKLYNTPTSIKEVACTAISRRRSRTSLPSLTTSKGRNMSVSSKW